MSASAFRLVLAALPALINAQSLTTYRFSIAGEPTSVVVPLPDVPTMTVYKTLPATLVTRTTQLPRQIATETIVLTAPVGEISSIADSIPKSYQVPNQQAVSGTPGPVVPITFGGFTTSIHLPAAVSVPKSPVTLSPVVVGQTATGVAAGSLATQAAGQETSSPLGSLTGAPTSVKPC